MEERFVLGIDVGGTNIRAGLVDTQFGLHEFKMEKTANITAGGNTVENLIELVKKYLAEHAEGRQVVGISIGFPSTIDKSRRVILSTPNVAGLNNLNIVDVMEEKVGIPTFINKDVNMLMLFDMHHGSIPDDGITTGFYLGTGLGNAISINGELLIGKNGAAAELGHIPTRDGESLGKCGCGNTGCMELFASGKYLQHLCDTCFEGTFIGDIFEKHGDHEIIHKFVHDLALPVAAEINILDPDYIILGGGLTQMKAFPKELLEAAIHEHARKPYPERNLKFVYSVPGQENGVIGAGIHGFKQLDRKAGK